MAVRVLDKHLREIRNIQVSRQDLDCLLPNKKEKLPSTTINAFGAYLQRTLDNASKGADDPAIFSSWLGAIALGVAEANENGSFEEHVILAVSVLLFNEIR